MSIGTFMYLLREQKDQIDPLLLRESNKSIWDLAKILGSKGRVDSLSIKESMNSIEDRA